MSKPVNVTKTHVELLLTFIIFAPSLLNESRPFTTAMGRVDRSIATIFTTLVSQQAAGFSVVLAVKMMNFMRQYSTLFLLAGDPLNQSRGGGGTS